MDEFLGCSDKVRPRFVCETAVRNADVNPRVQEDSTSEMSESSNPENLNQHVSHNGHNEAAPKAMAAASHKQQKANVNKRRKRKRGAADLGEREEESDIIKLLKAQQEVITKSEEKDKKLWKQSLSFRRIPNNAIRNSLFPCLEKLETFSLLKSRLTAMSSAFKFYSLLLLY